MSIFDEIVRAYQEPGRHYHNLDHINALLTLSATHAAMLRDRDAVDLAIFFHDVVYDAARSDNEIASAKFARNRLARLGRPMVEIAMIAHWIEMSKHGRAQAAPTDTDLAHFLDFDLSILAAERSLYQTYAQAIRREYALYPDPLYQKGRREVLLAFLAKPVIYRTPHLRDAWEAAARANMAWEASTLA